MSESAFVAKFASGLRLVVVTQGGCQSPQDDFFVTARNSDLFVCSGLFLKIFLPLRQSWPSSLVQEKTIVPLSLTSAQVSLCNFVMTETS